MNQTLENIINTDKNIDNNTKLILISEKKEYKLIKNISMSVDNSNTFIKLLYIILTNDKMNFYMENQCQNLSNQEIDMVFDLLCNNIEEKYLHDKFFQTFLCSKENLNNFVIRHKQYFIDLIRESQGNISYVLMDSDKVIELFLNENNLNKIQGIEKYSVSNLKLLVSIIKTGKDIPYYVGKLALFDKIIEEKEELSKEEFFVLLKLLKDKKTYVQNEKNLNIFNDLIKENIDYLFEISHEFDDLPACLAQSDLFRELCIERNNIKLAVKCTLPKDVTENKELCLLYAEELGLDIIDFYTKIKYVVNYYKRNENVFETIIASSLKENIFKLESEHFERFINDVSVQLGILKLSEKENILFNEIIKRYSYKDFELSTMIVEIIKNINYYEQLINKLKIEELTEKDIVTIIKVIKKPENKYNINNIEDIRNYDEKKKIYVKENIDKKDLEEAKEILLEYIFEISYEEAKKINLYYFNDRNKKVLNDLKETELPDNIYTYFELLNNILEEKSKENIVLIYKQNIDKKLYTKEIPFETYLRSEYIKLYSKTLYNPEEEKCINKTVSYNEKNVNVFIPRENFKFMVHCIGSCSNNQDIGNTNYQKDWEYRPQLQDHFLACSYMSENGIYSLRSKDSIILGFNELEAGSLHGMGDTDIDSIGYYATSYNGSKELMDMNNGRARFFVPSLMLNSINNGYNEIVIERRNLVQEKKSGLKKTADYIIMMSDLIEEQNLMLLNQLYKEKFSFITKEDQINISENKTKKSISEILENYNDAINKMAKEINIKKEILIEKYTEDILNAIYFENCIKASEEFDVPLIIIEKEYYFKKILKETKNYTEEEKEIIYSKFLEYNNLKRATLFNAVSQGKNVDRIINPEKNNQLIISI
ncbi:MAG: hypothetical protein R3Y13_06020 [bacterium]